MIKEFSEMKNFVVFVAIKKIATRPQKHKRTPKRNSENCNFIHQSKINTITKSLGMIFEDKHQT
jgi:hypothetical protein